MIAFRMAGKTLGWVNDEVLVFVECQPAELRSGDVCLATTTRPRVRSKMTTIGIARSAGGRNAKIIEPLRPSRNPFSADDPAVKALLRVCYRLRSV